MESSRETHYYLMGKAPGQDMVNFLQIFENALFVSGEFGSGKTTLIRALLKTNKYIFVTKKTPRAPRMLEREGKIPFVGITIDHILKQIRNESDTYFICRNVMFEAQDLFEQDDHFKLIKQFISVYSLTEIYRTCQEAKEIGKTVVFEITPEQERDWVFFFPKGVYIRLKVRRNLLVKRLLDRQKMDPQIDPSGNITRLKIRTSQEINRLEEKDRFDSWYRYKLIRLSNNNYFDFITCYFATRIICELRLMLKRLSPSTFSRDSVSGPVHGGAIKILPPIITIITNI